ncbi:MAG: RNB domain-containing ribonuclease [Bacilli bacterium]|nr:RNB domain-containing ribonuclease [Bacilli bacterium]
MKNIEKQLTNYINDKCPLVKDQELLSYKNVNELVDILFSVINKELDTTLGEKSLNKIRILLDKVVLLLSNSDQVDRKIVSRKLNKIDSKMNTILIEKKEKFKNKSKIQKEFKKTSSRIIDIEKILEEKDTKPYDLIMYLVEEVKDTTYIEYSFLKMPSLINVKDKDDNTLYYNIIKKYINSLVIDNYEDSLYYNNILSLLNTNNNFRLSEKERRKCIDYIYKEIDHIKVNKKRINNTKEKVSEINQLLDIIKKDYKEKDKMNRIAKKYNINVYFDESIQDNLKLVKESKIGQMTDREVIDDYIITIDKESAIEIDDALSCKRLANGNYLLGVHIASVLSYFDYDSDIVREALNRIKSIYLSHKYQEKDDDFNRTIPLFPYDFSAKIASLVPNEKKLTRSYIFEIDKNGNIVDEEFKKTIITSNNKTTYREIDYIINNDIDNKELKETVDNLYKVANILDKKYSPKEIYEQIKESTDDYSDLRVKRIGAEKIVYHAMLLTGNRVAEFFNRNNYPCLYRVHEVNEDNELKIRSMIDSLIETYGGEEFKKLYQLLEGIYPKGWYAKEGSHEGLGIEHYCHCTSGLRRAADIVVEHALEVCYDKSPTKQELEELEKEIEKRANLINSKQDPIEWFVKDYKRSFQKRR